MARVRHSSQAAHTPELARRYIQQMVRRGAMDFDMAAFQLEAIATAERSGRQILLVEDVGPGETDWRLSDAA